MKMRISPAELHLAVKRGLVKELGRLLEASGDPNAVYRNVTLLGQATSSEDIDMVKVLLKAGADPSCTSQGLNGRLEPPLYTACRLRNEAMAELLIEAGANVNCCDFYGHTPLWVATKGQRPMLVWKLLVAGSRLGSNHGYEWSDCPLYLVTKYLGYSGRRQLARFLLAAGSDPTVFDAKGRSAFYWCLKNRDYDLFSFMIEAFNPYCWTAILQQRVEDLLSELPEEHVALLQEQLFNLPSLANQCRLAIRQHLLKQFDHRSLFLAVPLLPLPAALQRFLLFGEEHPREELIPCFMKSSLKLY